MDISLEYCYNILLLGSSFFGHVSQRCNNGTESIAADHDHHEPGGVQAKHSKDDNDDDNDKC